MPVKIFNVSEYRLKLCGVVNDAGMYYYQYIACIYYTSRITHAILIYSTTHYITL